MEQSDLRAMLAEMYEERKALDPAYNYGAFGRDLAKMIGRAEPYKRQYVSNVLKGVKGYPVSAELADALQRLGAVADGVEEFQARLQPIPTSVSSMYPIHPGAIVMGQARLCATPGCGLWFVPNMPSRRYCPKCRPPHTPRPK